jgi:hypothetical protein
MQSGPDPDLDPDLKYNGIKKHLTDTVYNFPGKKSKTETTTFWATVAASNIKKAKC